MPDLTLPAELVKRMDAQPERGAPYFVSRNKMGAALIAEALDARDQNRSAPEIAARLAEKRKTLKAGPKLRAKK